MEMRIHIFGASGSGTSTLGRALASSLATQHFDTDDFFWHPSSPPFQKKRDVDERLSLMQKIFLPRSDWVLSGSLSRWGNDLTSHFDMAVLLVLDPEVRLARLAGRERNRYGTSIEQGEAMHQEYAAFMKWAKGYDDPQFPSRNIARHKKWLSELSCPTLMLDSDQPVELLVSSITSSLGANSP